MNKEELEKLTDPELRFVRLHEIYHDMQTALRVRQSQKEQETRQLYKKLWEEHERMYVGLVRKGLGLNEENDNE
jgi:hypothetical protein